MILNKKQQVIDYNRIRIFFSDVDGTLTDGCTYYSGKGEEMKKFNHKDGRANYLLRKVNIKFGIITGENTDIVKRRAEKLKANFCFLGIEDKLEFIKLFSKRERIELNEMAYIGDDTNDLEIIRNVGLSFAVNDSDKLIKETAHFVCNKNGGDGAFREAVDFLLEKRVINIKE